jgi:hypothetical protein
MTRDKESFSRKSRVALLVAVFVVLLPVWLPMMMVGLTLHLATLLVPHFLIWLIWLPKGKDMLFVYSESPIWHEYMTTQILPLVQERAVILNWSERKKWPKYSLPVLAFRLVGGYSNFNPLVIHFRPFRPAQRFRFWSAFKDWKHGDTRAVEQLRRELASVLEDRS